MTTKRQPVMSALAKEVKQWAQVEAGDRELKSRVAAALDQVRGFVSSHRSYLDKRKGRLLQTPGYKDETRVMEAALEKIQQLLAGGKNISRIYHAIDVFLDAYKENDPFDRDQIRTQLADASDDFIRRFHDSIRGSRLSRLHDILYFMPYSSWSSRSLAQRNFRSPSAAEVSKLLEEFRQRGIDVDSIDTVQLAALMRIMLGITPRMNFHLMPANKLAEKLTNPEVISRFSSKETPLDEGCCRTVAVIQANIRRWSNECFGRTSPPAPPEIEAEMLQLVYLATDTIRISGNEKERSADYLWLLATVVGSGHAVLRDLLTGLTDRNVGHPSVRERLAAANTYLDAVSARADVTLTSRWSEAKEELRSLIARTDAIIENCSRDYREYTELEDLKEKRSDVVKSLIKLSDSIQLIEPSLLDALAATEVPAGRIVDDSRGKALAPANLRHRNCRISDETRVIALQEFEKLRLLILRIREISRRGGADRGAPPPGQRTGETLARKTSDGVEIAKLPTADLHAKLCGALRKVAFTLRELRGKVEGVRRRPLKGDLQHAVNILHEKAKRAVETCDGSDPDAGDPARAVLVADGILPLLRDIMAAHTSVGARINSAKLTPAEKQPFAALVYGAKMRLGDDLRDLEHLRTELLGRSARTETGLSEDTGGVTNNVPPAPGPAADVADASPAPAAEPAVEEPEDAHRDSAVTKIAGLAAAAGQSLKPVKALMVGLNSALAPEHADSWRIFTAATALRSGIITARDVMTANLMQIKALAAVVELTTDGYVEKFNRWQGPLAVVEKETERLLKSMAAVADIQEAAAAAAVLEQGIADTLSPTSGERTNAGPFVPVRTRCVDALAAHAEYIVRLREAHDSLAAARSQNWKMLPAASRFVERLGSDLTASEQALRDSRTRIENIHNHFKNDRPSPR